MSDLFDQLALSDDERSLLAGLGVRTAMGLAAMIRASRDDVRRSIGDHARAVASERAVWALLTPEQRERPAQPVPPFELGARLTPPRKD